MSKLTLKQWRSLREMSREELAVKSGVSAKTIENYESDISNLRKASWQNIESITHALDIEMNDIYMLHTSKK